MPSCTWSNLYCSYAWNFYLLLRILLILSATQIPEKQKDAGYNHAVSALKFRIIKRFLALGYSVFLSGGLAPEGHASSLLLSLASASWLLDALPIS